jgi:MFS family permease
MAVVAFSTFFVMCFMVKEGEYPPPPRESDSRLAALFLTTVSYVRECFGKPYYLLVFATFSLAALTMGPVNIYSVFYARELGLDMFTYGKVKAINHFCGLLFAYPIGMLADRYHPLRVTMVARLLYGLTVLAGSIFIQGPTSFKYLVFGHLFVSGLYISASGALAQMLLPRLKFGQFASASLVVTSLLGMAMAYGLGVLLDATKLDATRSNYRLTYVVAASLAGITLVLMVILYRKFMSLGGPKGYVAPE